MKSQSGMEFANVARTNLSSQIAETISGRIDREEIVSGTQLPSERVLSEAFGVSRVSVRAAIQLLQATGYVEIRPGKGTFVVDEEVRNAASLQSWVSGRDKELLMMIELRLIVEPGVASLAAEKVTPESAATLLEVARELGECPRSEISKVDTKFHRQIAAMTNNPLICELLGASLLATEPLRDRTLQDHKRRLRATKGHLAVAEAIASGYPEAAHAAMISHLKDAQASL